MLKQITCLIAIYKKLNAEEREKKLTFYIHTYPGTAVKSTQIHHTNMKNSIRKIIFALTPALDAVLSPFIALASIVFFLIRKIGIDRFPIARRIFMKIGIFPIWKHYYEPLFDASTLTKSLRQDRVLPGIDWNVNFQLALLEKLKKYAPELDNVPFEKNIKDDNKFYFNNGSYSTGDAEFLYAIIRYKKPRRIIEIGSGNSTLIARLALEKNMAESKENYCRHICIEPYEMPWLEKSGVEVIRERVEECELDMFRDLQAGDILFIDSSHIIRPQGDVLFEYLQILPILKTGVIVHIHDIFSPRDYLDEWLHRDVKLWNEQYLLEAFMTFNNSYQIIAGLNFLHHNHHDKLVEVCKFLKKEREPGAFYIECTNN